MAITYHIVTFGCQMNSHDSELMAGMMVAKGWHEAESEEQADVLLYNTCVVRGHAEERALARLSQLKALKKKRPGMIMGVCGCLAQKEAERLLERFPHLDLVLGPRAIARLGPLLDGILANGQRRICVEVLDQPYPADVIPLRRRKLKTMVNIILGCNKDCSYCIVPRTRGREVSRPVADILAEVRHLAGQGAREITLIGQNVNAYRPDGPDKGVDFSGLLRQVNQAAGQSWIRAITAHPRDCDDAHITAVAECDNVCENFHLPVQAGSSEVLRRMRRGYTREHYLDLAERIRSVVPDATLTTDFIVGFPGETEDDFDQTLDLARQVRFDSAYMYFYSPRPGTPAAEEFPEQIPLAVRKERLARLIVLQERISLEINRDLIGRTVPVLVEDLAPRNPGDLLARTRGDKMVILPGPESWIGRFLEVKIKDANGHTLFGSQPKKE